MTRLLKTLLLWLLIASLPVRGWAAVDTSCGVSHNGNPVSGMALNAEVGTLSHHMEVVATTSDSDQHMVPMAGHSSHDQHSHKNLNDNSCAACYIGAVAPPLTEIWAAEPQISDAVLHFPAISFTGFIPSGLERPPRHILA